MRNPTRFLGMLAAVLALPVAIAAEGVSDREAALRDTETAFAATMARRDFEAFASFLAPETIFFGRGDRQMRGKAAVLEAWKEYYEGAAAPFSWKPETVAVLDTGELGLTAGPVFDPAGRRIGTFMSVWRRNADGTWSIVLDRGCPWCEPDKTEP